MATIHLEAKESLWNHAKWLLRSKPRITGEPTESDTTFCSHCGKPVMDKWVNIRDNIGFSEELYDGMHLECFKEVKGREPNIFKKFIKADGDKSNKPREI